MGKSINDLLVLSGPLAIGKSYTLEKVASNQLNHFAPLYDLGSISDWELITPSDYLKERQDEALPKKVVFHYELTRLITRPGFELTDFDKDPVLKIVDSARTVNVLSLWAPGYVISARLRGRMPLTRRITEQFRPSRRHKAVLALFKEKDRFVSLYRAWISYWEAQSWISHTVWDVSGSTPDVYSVGEFRKILKAYQLQKEV